MESFEAFKAQWERFTGPLNEEELATCKRQYHTYLSGALDNLFFEKMDTVKVVPQLEQVLRYNYQHQDLSTPKCYLFVYPSLPSETEKRWALSLEQTPTAYLLQYDLYTPPSTPDLPEPRHTITAPLPMDIGLALDQAITTQMERARKHSGKWHMLDGVLHYIFKQFNGQWEAVRLNPREDATPPVKLLRILTDVALGLETNEPLTWLSTALQELDALTSQAIVEEQEGLRMLAEHEEK